MNSYTINESAVSHELIDGEVIVIHFASGNYYSLTGTAAVLWSALKQQASTAELAKLFTSPNETEIQTFLDELVVEELLLRSEDPAVFGVNNPPVAYATPELNKYTDMQQLLLADPLHEVDDAGWPHTKEAS